MGEVGPRAAHQLDHVGDVIAGKYRVVRALGEGGMGAVLEAWHELLDIPVAIKVLSTDLTRDPQTTSRFLREAQAVARLKSEHVARVMDVGTTADGRPFIVMELLEGQDLDRRVEQGPLPVPLVVDFVLQAAEAVAQAHAIGIVHRDLKPANLFAAVQPDGHETIKVLDFGVAKLVDGSGSGAAPQVGALTGERTIVGSPSYMAPEQVRAERVDSRTDIWALGTIVYELLTGKTAFAGGSVGEIFGAILHTPPLPLRTLRPEVPAGLEAVASRCMAHAADDRYRDLGELGRAIAPFGSGAYDGYPARIEQTLRRAAAGFDPESTTGTRLRTLNATDAAALLEPVAPPSRPTRTGNDAPTNENAASLANTLPAPALLPALRRWAPAIAVAVVVAGLGLVALLWEREGAPPSRLPESTTQTAASSAPLGPLPSSLPILPREPVAAEPLPTVALTAPLRAPAAAPSRVAPAHHAKPKGAPSGLPGVLRSAE